MRGIPHPLTVIVAQGNNSSQPAGLLVSSFNTVTLHPVPYISFNLKLPSSTFDEIKQSRIFGASAIADVRLARDFLLAKKDSTGSENSLYNEALQRNVQNGQIGRLMRGRGAIWWMKCHWAQGMSVTVGDHVIMVARVLQGEYYEHLDGQTKASEIPLVYAEGRYRTAGPPIA